MLQSEKVKLGKPRDKRPTKFELLKEASEHGHLVWTPNGIRGFVQVTIETLGVKRSTIKFSKGGYNVIKTSRIRLNRPKSK